MTGIRDAASTDSEALAALLRHLGYEAAAADLPARIDRFLTRGNGRVLVAERDGRVVGFAAFELAFPIHRAQPIVHLVALSVAPGARRKGVGRALLDAVEAAARASGCEAAVVTSAEHRADAHEFYPAAGWSYTGRRFGKILS